MRPVTSTKTKAASRAKSAKRGTSRNQRTPNLWRRRFVLAGLGTAVSATLGLGILCFATDIPSQTISAIHTSALNWSVRNGFNVADVQAVGRKNTSTHDILAALGIHKTTSILAIDLEDSQHRIETLPWVKTAHVERHLPNVLRIVISERLPVAISQIGKKSMLIDETGTSIVPTRSDINNLPIITGKGAPQHIAELLQEMSQVPELAKRVRAAVRVGNRRWNIRLDSVDGIELRLPETNLAESLLELVALNQSHKLLRRDVSMIDLRLPDRLIVRLANGQTLPAVNLGPTSQSRRKGRAAA